MSGDHTTMVAPNPNAPDAFMYGIWKPMDSVLFSANFNMVGNHADIVKVVQLYPLSSTFQKASRRFITVDADYNAIETELLKIHATGIREVFIKTRFKQPAKLLDRTSVVQGTRGSVRVDLGGRRIINKKITVNHSLTNTKNTIQP